MKNERFENGYFNSEENNFCDYQGTDRGEKEKERETKCCCKKSMEAALKLLCVEKLADLIDFKKFAFLTDDFVIGSNLTLLGKECKKGDNLADLNAIFKRFSPCNCDVIEIEGAASYNIPIPNDAKVTEEQLEMLIKKIIDILVPHGCDREMSTETLKEVLKISKPKDVSKCILEEIIKFLKKAIIALPKVEEISLCAIEAVAFEAKYKKPDCCQECCEKKEKDNFQKAKCILQELLEDPHKKGKNKCGCECNCDCDECCCTKGIIKEVFATNLGKNATLTAGNLVLKDAKVLGIKGDVIVLASDQEKRFYFVCANAVQALK